MTHRLSCYVVDDEPLAMASLVRLLQESGRVTVTGSSTDPATARRDLNRIRVDVLFLDIRMPEIDGFELLTELERQPAIVFTTAYDEFALQAFEVNSIDYLLKPIDSSRLGRTLDKLERFVPGGPPAKPSFHEVLSEISGLLHSRSGSPALRRLASRVGNRTVFVNLADVTHIIVRDQCTYAVTEQREYALDSSITQLEDRLDPETFVRIHRSAMVNVQFVAELSGWFGGKRLVRLRDAKRTQLTVTRDRIGVLREALGAWDGGKP